MIDKLHAILRDIAARRSRQRFHGGLAITWWLGLVVGWLLWKNGVPARILAPALGMILLAASVGVFLWSRRGLNDPRRIAREIEAKHPELETGLLAALDQAPDSGASSLTFLQSQVVLMSLVSAARDHWIELVPRPRLTGLRLANLAGFLFIIAATCLMLRPVAKQVPAIAQIKAAAAVLDFAVEPGDVEIERGSPLTVQAQFGDTPPATATLETTDETGLVQSIPLTRPFTGPVYQARLAAVAGPLTYKVVTPEGATRSYTVRVFDLPALRQSEVVLHFPGHLGKPPETIKDPRAIRAEENTRMDLTLVANLPGLSASLVAKNKEPINLSADAAESSRFHLSMTLTESARYEIVLTDSAGRRNSRKDILDIKVIPNKAPVVQVVLPQKNEKVTPIQEVRLEARVTDDSALLAHGLRYTLDGEKWQEIAGSPAPGDKRPLLSQLVDLESLDAHPKDVLMWNAWAEDIGPDGNKRRVNGDIHLMQVRDFDEEFYQQSAPPGPPGSNPAADLIKTQTGILNSTWNLRRDHTEIAVTPPPAKDLETLRSSQEIAMETAAAMEAEQIDPAIRQILTDARLAMKDALAELTQAHEKTSAAPLEPAIGHEQTALRHLYQLKGNKTMMVQSQGEGESSSAEEKPKDDLDLKPMDNPYQAEKEAKPETAGKANEAMEILKRLDELAKRQRDLNEEMQALQAALTQADTAAKKAEIERQLKQLREQQKELLADVDDLRQKTSDPAQQATQPQQNKALDDAREKARQANEELKDNKLGEALASGRRAEEALEKLHDDFRETSAAQLAEQLRELRKDARALDERQRELGDPSAEPAAPKAPDLSDNAEAKPQVAQQREDLKKLLDGIRETAETAEKAEPLVAQDLAEALRQADQNGIAKALEQMEQAPGEVASNRAADGISKLTREVEGAAERILGNEAQALRYARDELQRLAEQAAGKPQENGKPGESGKPGEQAGEPGEGGEPSEQAGKTGESGEPGERAGKPGEGGEPGEQAGKPGEGGQPGEQAGKPGENGQPGQTAGQPGETGEPGSSPSSNPGSGQGQAQASSPAEGRGSGRESGGSRRGRSSITGEDFREWSERLSDLEAVVEDPEAQSAVARARKASREMRKDFKRHSLEPDQAALEEGVLRPLTEAAGKLDARLHELDRKDPLAPVGRDPVPERYAEIVRRYFEELGK
ncbi:MAG: hypothetical protein V4819_14225 [Verrucomicrobiota bacterium]